MASKSRTTLKAALEDGDTFDSTIAGDMVDSAFNLSDTTAQTATSNLTIPSLNATTEVSSPSVKASAATIGTVTPSAIAGTAMTLNVATTVAGSALAGSAVVSATSWLQITINGNVRYIPAFASA